MNLTFDESDLRPIITAVVAEVLAQREADHERINGRLSYNEAAGAELIGVARHQLRDARLRGEITASRVGKSVLYSRDDLLSLLERCRL